MTLRPPRVLLVDDDLDTREMYGWSLEARGFLVSTASTGINALGEAGADPPDIVITDFALPGMDGLALAARLREVPETARIPVVLLSGHELRGELADAALSTCEKILLKPVLPDQLADDILRIVIVRSAEQLRTALAAVREGVSVGPGASPVESARAIIATVTEVFAESNVSAAALVADDEAHYIEANEEASAITGHSRRDILKSSVWDFTPSVQLVAGQRMWKDFIARGSMEGPYSLTTASGAVVSTWFSAMAHVLPGLHLSLLTPMPASQAVSA